MKSFRSVRHMLLAGCAALAIVPSVSAAQGAATARVRFDIPAQTLDGALTYFGQQSGRELIVAADITRGRRAPAVQGQFTAEQALGTLLAGSGLIYRTSSSGSIVVEAAQAPQPESAGPGAQPTAVDEVIVTAQKKAERIQDVPIAISAFGKEALEAQKIEGGFDLLKVVPNVTFSKSNYSSYNFSIRGIGTKAVSATSDPGVAISFNNTTLIRNRLFEQEYFDVERVEVLRGPQGTLYGRNATAGVVNMITAKPEFDDFEGSVKVEVGNYDARRMVGMVNVPLGDMLAVRLAGSSTERSGFGTNLTTGNDVDGRDLWSTRLSVAFKPNDRFRADFVWEHFDEDDNRLRTGKQLCHRDDGPTTFPGFTQNGGILNAIQQGRLSQGCKPGSLYSKDAYGAPNGLSIPFVAAGQLLVPLGKLVPDGNPFGPTVMMLTPGVDPYGVEQSRDLRTMASMFDPKYRAKADVLALNFQFDLTDALTLTSQTLYNKDEVYSFQDYNRFATQPSFGDSSGLFNPILGEDPTLPGRLQSFSPGGYFDDPQIGRANTVAGFEISSSDSEQFSQEFRVQSSFDGPLNFTAGVNYTKFEALNDYYLFFNIVTMLAQGFYNQSPDPTVCNSFSTTFCMHVDANPLESVDGAGHNYFRNKNPYRLESKAAFGEAYWDVTDTVKITAGLRYTDDRKSFTPWRSQLLVYGDGYGPSDPINQRWTETTGRLGIDWHPVLPFTDDTMVYAFYSRGYKGGGANPPPAEPVDNGNWVVSEIPPTFDPEFVNAYEIGAKNTLLNGALVLNGTAFYYDYKGYQISKVVDRTIVNENFDAEVWGAELEAVWRPTKALRLNASLGYLGTRIADGEKSIDIFDRTQGQPGWTLLTPWIQQTSNCILPSWYVADLLNAGLTPPPFAALSPLLYNGCSTYSANAQPVVGFNPDDYPEVNNGAGFYDDLSGNELPNAPHWTFSVGAEYRMEFDNGWAATVRGDYYSQAESWSRVYNREGDYLEGWGSANLSLTLNRSDDDLAIQLYVKNVFDETPITDAFLNSDSTGMTTNIFTLDPRLIGLSVTKGF
jgi:iron complex outermembrane receptor protein